MLRPAQIKRITRALRGPGVTDIQADGCFLDKEREQELVAQANTVQRLMADDPAAPKTYYAFEINRDGLAMCVDAKSQHGTSLSSAADIAH